MKTFASVFFAPLPNSTRLRVIEPAEVIKKWTHQKFQSWLSQHPTMSPWASYFLLLGLWSAAIIHWSADQLCQHYSRIFQKYRF